MSQVQTVVHKKKWPIYTVRLCRMRQAWSTTGLRHELFRVSQTYKSLTTVVYVDVYAQSANTNGVTGHCLQNLKDLYGNTIRFVL